MVTDTKRCRLNIKQSLFLLALGLAASSCSREASPGSISKVEAVSINAADTRAILAAVGEYQDTSRARIASCEDWGQNDGVTEYKVVVEDSQTPDERRSYWLTHTGGTWRVVSREL